MATEASKGCSIHVGAPIRVTLSPAPKKVFELISACIMHPPCHEQKIRVEATALRPWRRPHFSPVHRENGPVFERTDSPLRLLELIRSHTSFAVSVSRASPTRLQSPQAVVGNFCKTVSATFFLATPTKYVATKCRELPRHIVGDCAN